MQPGPVRLPPCPGPLARCRGPGASATGHPRLPRLLGLLGLHGGPDPGFQPAVLDQLVFPQHRGTSGETGLLVWLQAGKEGCGLHRHLALNLGLSEEWGHVATPTQDAPPGTRSRLSTE